MGFFKSVFSTDPNPSSEEESSRNPNPHPPWNFGGLIKTIASRSESVISTYRRDLREFSVELKKEASIFKSVAQESIESLISHGKEVPLSIDPDSNSLESNSLRKVSTFEVQVLAIQNDENTFSKPSEDERVFKRWRLGFKLEEKEDQIEVLLYENDTLEGYFEKLVPEVLDRETFWSRYFYRVYRLKMAEDDKAKLGKRGVLHEEEEEEELNWAVDDGEEKKKGVEETKEEVKEGENDNEDETVEEEEQTKEEIVYVPEKPKVPKIKYNVHDGSSPSKDEMSPKSKSKTGGLAEGRDQDISLEEIEDFGEGEKAKIIGSSGSLEGVDLRKRISIALDDEELTWDIEDDDDEDANL